jgi:hypothetical protein
MVDTEANNAIELHNTLIDGGRRAFYRPVLLPLFMNGVEVEICELRRDGVLRSSRQTRATVIMQQQGKPQGRIIGSCAVSDGEMKVQRKGVSIEEG